MSWLFSYHHSRIDVVAINALIGFFQEGTAEKAVEAIRETLTNEAIVQRDGQNISIAVEAYQYECS